MSAFKPMLSATLKNLDDVAFPVLVSPKLDGIRAIIRGGQVVSRNLKPIPNAHIQRLLGGLPDGLDGELIVGAPVGEDVWNRTNSGVMSADGEPDFRFHVFDIVCTEDRFADRIGHVHKLLVGEYPHAAALPHRFVNDIETLSKIEDHYVGLGYEGVMLRDPNGRYKYGRSTMREGGLIKMKRWHSTEATVVDFVERMHNGNEATIDELGRTKRSTHKANKTGRGDLGALVCKLGEQQFELGTGFTDAQRAMIWKNRPDFNGQLVEFKYQNLTPDGIPRFPVFMRFRYADTPDGAAA